jgi:hypothetical protein
VSESIVINIWGLGSILFAEKEVACSMDPDPLCNKQTADFGKKKLMKIEPC